jgi:hypothetical protein
MFWLYLAALFPVTLLSGLFVFDVMQAHARVWAATAGKTATQG